MLHQIKRKSCVIYRTLLVVGAFMTTDVLLAHHSVPVNFDQTREITVEGILTEVTWLNPHSRFRLDVPQDDGTTLEWLVEMGAINTMRRAGFETELFHVGAPVAITGSPGRRDRTVLLTHAFVDNGAERVCVGRTCPPATND